MSIAAATRTVFLGRRADQAIRISRLLFATSTYLFGVALAGYGTRHGLMADAGYGSVLAGAILVNLAFYVLIRTGWNLRLRDPSLTAPQIVVATAVNSYLVFHAGPARGALLMGYALILVFGIFRLRWRQFLYIGTAVVATYGGIIWHDVQTARPGLNLPLEILQLTVLCFIYPWFALVGAYVGRARERQRRLARQLEQSLRENRTTLAVVRKQASRDELTGILNRRSVTEALERARHRSRTDGGAFCVFLVDIDHFKRINDTAGHLVGDRVLALCAQTIAAQLRPVDTLGRWGGEEFLLVVPAGREEIPAGIAQRNHLAVREIELRAHGQAAHARLT
ncbi:MAG: GGDEF domain-containing protein, partial [Burkholderiaceae bacterium]